jgi:hypothetical protein
MTAPTRPEAGLPRLTDLADPEDLGALGVVHLKRMWSRTVRSRETGGARPNDGPREWDHDDLVIRGLGLNLREAYSLVHETWPSYDAFEAAVAARVGDELRPENIARLNAALRGADVGAPPGATDEPVLDEAALAFFAEHGYVVVRDAVAPEQSAAAAAAVWEHVGADRAQPDTWYRGPQGHSIWVPLVRHPTLAANRRAPRVHRAFAQLWERDDLWPNVDQTGFNPPERPGWKFPGPNLHWDVSLATPIPFGLQGMLYLEDVAPEQGAFTCVPGFHNRAEAWLAALPPDVDPRRQDLVDALGAVPIAAPAGSLVIWHHALPHGSSPNRSTRPRVVQYLQLAPSRRDTNPVWR